MEAEDREAQDRESRLSRIGIFVLRGFFGLLLLSFILFLYLYYLSIIPPSAKIIGLIVFILVHVFFVLLPIRPPIFWKIIFRALLITVFLFLLRDGLWIASGHMSLERFVERWTESQYSLGAVVMHFFLEWMALLVLVPLRRPEKTSDENYWL